MEYFFGYKRKGRIKVTIQKILSGRVKTARVFFVDGGVISTGELGEGKVGNVGAEEEDGGEAERAE